MIFGFVDPSALDELQVIVQRDNVVQNGETDEHVVARGGPGKEQVELAEEPSQRRNACQAKHGYGKRDGEGRVLLAEPA